MDNVNARLEAYDLDLHTRMKDIELQNKKFKMGRKQINRKIRGITFISTIVTTLGSLLVTDNFIKNLSVAGISVATGIGYSIVRSNLNEGKIIKENNIKIRNMKLISIAINHQMELNRRSTPGFLEISDFHKTDVIPYVEKYYENNRDSLLKEYRRYRSINRDELNDLTNQLLSDTIHMDLSKHYYKILKKDKGL